MGEGYDIAVGANVDTLGSSFRVVVGAVVDSAVGRLVGIEDGAGVGSAAAAVSEQVRQVVLFH